MHMVLDLETLDTKSSAVVTAIGISVCSQSYRPDNSAWSFLPRVQDQMDRGRTVSWGTTIFWLTQDDSARLALCVGDTVREPVWDIYEHIEYLWKYFECKRIWGNGSTFDVIILESLFHTYGITPPWEFRQIRDMRTLAELKPDVLRTNPVHAHQAQWDALAQAQWLHDMMQGEESYEDI